MCIRDRAATAHSHNGIGQGFGGSEIGKRRAARDDLFHPLLEQIRSDPAGRAPAAGLIDKEVRELERDLKHVAPRTKDCLLYTSGL